MKFTTQHDLRLRPISSDLEHNKKVEPKFWPWLFIFTVKVKKTFQ